jgi:perosamine synthetase
MNGSASGHVSGYTGRMPAPLPSARPRLPLAPVLSLASFGAPRTPQPRGVLTSGPARLVTSGRIAIANALHEMGVGPGDSVLVPAYHSLSMIPPVLACGAQPVFYKVGPDASVDLDDLATHLQPSVRVLMATNYFGVPQALDRLRAFCDLHGLLLLEDCAHCFFGEHAGRAVGAWGDYAIASSMKFFPIYEGGCLVSAHHPLRAAAPQSAGWGFEAKAGLNALEASFGWGRLALLHALLWLPLRLKDALRRRARHSAPSAPALAPSSSDSSVEFDPRWLDKRSSWFSRLVLRRASHARIVALRREHYLQLQQALAGLPGCRPLFAQLPAQACPWMFPLWVDDPEPLFARLLAAGVPVTRFAQTLWPGVDASVCANSVALSQHVLAFPCHQELRADELAWLAAAIRTALHP